MSIVVVFTHLQKSKNTSALRRDTAGEQFRGVTEDFDRWLKVKLTCILPYTDVDLCSLFPEIVDIMGPVRL